MAPLLTTPLTKFATVRLRALVLATLVGGFIGFFHILEPVELAMHVTRNNLNERQASGTIVLVAIDDRSAAEIGSLPWGGNQVASMIERIRNGGARSLHVDADLSTIRNDADLARVEAALESVRGRLSLPARLSIDPITHQRSVHLPPERLARHAMLVNTNIRVGWDGTVRFHPYNAPSGGRRVPSLASRLSGRTGAGEELFPIDYSIDPRSVPVVSASDLLLGRVPQKALSGHSVILARTDLAVERVWTPGHGPMPASMIHILAAETLLVGRPVSLGWLLPLMIGSVLAALLLFSKRRSVAWGSFVAAWIAAGLVPLILDQAQLFASVLPGLAVVIFAAGMRRLSSVREAFYVRGTTNLTTGLPNMQALRLVPCISDSILVVARVRNYPQITASLQPRHEKELVEQIVTRLSFGTDGAVTYQLDEGVFVWVATDRHEDTVIQQIEGLHALFRNPVVIDRRLIDLSMTFGLDLGSGRPVLQRVPRALIAADSAAREGKRWGSFNVASLDDADWAMSLLARLDRAIEADELWVAYQPVFDLQLGRITGAEALVRWSHPEKGQIFPDEFIGAAEEGGRIEQLTYFVLDRALETAAIVNANGRTFGIAVNLSAQLLTSDSLVSNIERLLRQHGVSPHLLTLEVTETSTMASAEETVANLQQLADLGVLLSIDDYGTGFSTLDYLKRIPASELKIDRSFISMLHKSQSDRIMVNSTIQLAHSLGRKVVAEGIETEEILTELRKMGCDLGQGYHLARPGTLTQLLDVLALQSEDQPPGVQTKAC